MDTHSIPHYNVNLYTGNMDPRRNKFIIAIVVVVLLVGSIAFYIGRPKAVVNDFESCVAAGNPVQESFPRRCADADGNVYVESLENDPMDVEPTENGGR